MNVEADPGPERGQTAWVVPVEVDQLCAHLQAYNERVVARTSLQQCSKYGSGSISRMPEELLDLIADHLEEDLRKDHTYTWKSRYYLLTGEHSIYTLDYIKDCLLQDDNDEFIDYCLSFWAETECPFCTELSTSLGLSRVCSYCQGLFDEKALWREHPAAEKLLDSLSYQATWEDAARIDSDAWLDDVKLGQLICQEEEELLQRHFGMKTWIYNVFPSDWRSEVSTMALLIPQSTSPQQMPEQREYHHDDTGYLHTPWLEAAPDQRQDAAPVKAAIDIVLQRLNLTVCPDAAGLNRLYGNQSWPILLTLKESYR